MAQLSANFELGVNGATIQTTDTGSATAWDVVSIGANASALYASTPAYDSMAGVVATGTTSATTYLQWSTALGTVTDHYGRMYVYPTGSTSATFLNFNTGGTAGARLRMKQTTRQIEVLDNLAAVVGTTTNSLNLNGWSRVEWHIVHSTTVGSVEIKLFTSPDLATPTETLTLTNLNTAASSNSVRLGYSVAGANLSSFYMDGIIANATSYPGPLVRVVQSAGNVTATGGTQTVATSRFVALSQLAGAVTATGGTQTVTSVQSVSIAQTAASVSATGGTQVVDTINNGIVAQLAGSVTSTGGTQTLSAMVDIAIAQQAANVLATGGTQTVSAAFGTSSASITQTSAVVTATGGLQIISTNTSPLPPANPKSIIFLTDGHMAIRLGGNIYQPL